MDKLQLLEPENPNKLWNGNTMYDVIETVWKRLNETRAIVNNALDVIESDIQSNDYAAIKALSAVNSLDADFSGVDSRISEMNTSITQLWEALKDVNPSINDDYELMKADIKKAMSLIEIVSGDLSSFKLTVQNKISGSGQETKSILEMIADAEQSIATLRTEYTKKIGEIDILSKSALTLATNAESAVADLIAEYNTKINGVDSKATSALNLIATANDAISELSTNYERTESKAQSALNLASSANSATASLKTSLERSIGETKTKAENALTLISEANQSISALSSSFESANALTNSKAESALTLIADLDGSVSSLETSYESRFGNIDTKAQSALTMVSDAIEAYDTLNAEYTTFKSSANANLLLLANNIEALAQLEAKYFNADGELKNKSGVVAVSGGDNAFSSLYASAVAADGSIVKESSFTARVEEVAERIVSTATISADHIDLQGLTTFINNNVINEDDVRTIINENSLSESTINSLINSAISDLRDQIDGEVDTWYYDGVPSLTNMPASEWVQTATEDNSETYEKHIGDLYYNKTTGRAYRFLLDGDTYSWVEIVDSDIRQALENAAKAQATADGKMTVYYAIPKPPYNKGDIWVNATYTGKFSNDIVRCTTSRTAVEGFNINDWVLASNYVDIADVEAAIDSKLNGYEDYVTTLARLGITEVDGGLVMTNLIKMRDTQSNVTAGMNGICDSNSRGNGIAAWFGGEMVDHEANPTANRYAKAAIRHDGSGYVAGGAITWDNNGVSVTANSMKLNTNEGVVNIATKLNSMATTIESVKQQTDKQYTIWFYDYRPTNTNLPASEWNTDALKLEHEHDMFYYRYEGRAWKYLSGAWVEITDADTLRALEQVKEKCSVFVSTPVPPYNIGDLWTNATYTTGSESQGNLVYKYKDDLLKCIVSKERGQAFSISDWTPAVQMTTAAVSTLTNEVKAYAKTLDDTLKAEMRVYVNESVSGFETELSNTKGIAQNAVTTANYASQDAASAKTTATSASNTASSAATNALEAKEDSASALSIARSASRDATAASSAALEAKNDVATAITKAESATATANNASTTALNASNAAASAVLSATSANDKATNAATLAQTADTKASSAILEAKSATETATTASTLAQTASSDSAAATLSATNSTKAANDAKTLAKSAKETATAANNTATTANNTANNASALAIEASSDAATAVTLATSASETATNAATIAQTASESIASITQTVTSANTLATNAATLAQTASEDSALAILKAESASTESSNAITKANAASTKADSATSKANEANTKATSAASVAAKATNDLATLDSYVRNGDLTAEIKLSVKNDNSLIELVASKIHLDGEVIASLLETQKLTINNGAAIFEPDGSGQLANGNIFWDEDGNINIGGGSGSGGTGSGNGLIGIDGNGKLTYSGLSEFPIGTVLHSTEITNPFGNGYTYLGKTTVDDRVVYAYEKISSGVDQWMNDTFKPDYAVIDQLGMAMVDVEGTFYTTKASWQAAGSKALVGLAFSDGVHRFIMSMDGTLHPDGNISNKDISSKISYESPLNCLSYFYGKRDTLELLKLNSGNTGGAIKTCTDFIFPHGKAGYLWSTGEAAIVLRHDVSINAMLTDFGKPIFLEIDDTAGYRGQFDHRYSIYTSTVVGTSGSSYETWIVNPMQTKVSGQTDITQSNMVWQGTINAYAFFRPICTL